MHYEAHFAIYPPHHFYKKHVDQFTHSHDRKISCVFYLNEDWDPAHGGELILYNENDQPSTSILPIGNRMVCFNSTLVHEVQTTYRMRYSIASWLKSRPYD
jgi:SM-20-related protein